MKIIKLLIAIFATYFVTLLGNAYAQELCEECLENVPQDMRDYVYNMDYMDKDQPLGPAVM